MSHKQKDQISDEAFFFTVTALLLAVLWFRLREPLLLFYNQWRYGIALLITGILMAGYFWMRSKFIAWSAPRNLEKEVLASDPNDDSVFAGITPRGKSVFIKQSFRRMHTQIVGTTNAGKTESIILPWAIDDIKKGRGLLIIDGKSDLSLLNKLYAYAVKYQRACDVRILSLCNVDISHSFNPLDGGSVLEIAERVFSAFEFDNEYYKSIQYDAFLHSLLLLEDAKIKATPLRLIELLKSEKQMALLAERSSDGRLRSWVKNFLELKREEREQRTSGLIARLQNFAIGETAQVFNAENSDITLERALDEGQIVYCQLPALKVPTLGKVTGKMILQCLQSAVASRHLGTAKSQAFFSVYLDDFTEYLTPSFVTLLNKSRSANVAIVFAHQALGDLSALGDGVKNTILTNSNLKVFMRTNEPESAEYFSKVIGTTLSEKLTERQTSGWMGAAKTGDGSVREVEEFKFHPNLFKQELGVGEAVLVLPHAKGSLPVRVKLKKRLDLEAQEIPRIPKPALQGLPPCDLTDHAGTDQRVEHPSQVMLELLSQGNKIKEAA